MIKFPIKFLLAIIYIPTFLVIFVPVLFPVYFLLILFLVTYKIVCKIFRKFYNYFIRDTFELAEKMVGIQDLLLVDDPRPNRTPDLLIPHGKSLIEVYKTEGVYRIFNGEARDVGKNYLSLKGAREEIDEMEPLLSQ